MWVVAVFELEGDGSDLLPVSEQEKRKHQDELLLETLNLARLRHHQLAK